MPATTSDFHFHGQGDTRQLEPHKARIKPWDDEFGPWRRRRADIVPDDEHKPPEHPANYAASPDLVDAVNTSVALGKPLLVTGNPGTGKSQLAERVAWEFNLGPVLRFEAQSLSEANDLFYRFDLVGYLSAVELLKASMQQTGGGAGMTTLPIMSTVSPDQHLRLGPLGEAIVRSDPKTHEKIFDAVFAPETAAGAAPRPSVVLIDEVDKASRDFPNDLLNGIERREFSIRELGIQSVLANPAYPPIVIITSNSERDLPPPFLRRCTFFHIADPEQPDLEKILVRKFFPRGSRGEPRGSLPRFYKEMLESFVKFRDTHKQALQYTPGTSELIDWTEALRRLDVDENGSFGSQMIQVRTTLSSVAKHRNDHRELDGFLKKLVPKNT